MYDQAMSSRDQNNLAKVAPIKGVRQKAQRGSVTRELVVSAAIAAIHEGRYESMTIRSLAAELGVAPMTLYRHIRDRDDLLDEVTDRLLAKTWRPSSKHETWQDWIRDAAMRLRRLLVAQPAVLHVYLSHPVATPAALVRMQSMLSVLHDAGLDERTAERLYATIHTYTIGFAALEASRSKWSSTNTTADATMNRLAAFTTSKQFIGGLHLLLRGAESS